MSFRYSCSNETNAAAGFRAFHRKGNGKPRAKKCSYCGSAFYVEEGQWGVFVWSGGRGDYRPENAVKLFENEQKANTFADEHAHDNYVVRWCWKDFA